MTRRATLLPLLICVVLALVTTALYLPVRHHDFVSYDDLEYVVDNPNVTTGLTVQNVRWAFTQVHSSNWHPLTWLSHMLDCELWGLDAGKHHLVNVGLHALNAVLVFLIFHAMTQRLAPSAFVAALFAWHPLHVESVAWIAERKDVLSTLFWLLTMAAYVRFARRGGWGNYAAVILFFALGLMSKPMLVTLPFVLLLLDYWPLRRVNLEKFWPDVRARVFEKVPLFLLAAGSCAITLIAQQEAISEMPLAVRMGNACVSYVSYLAKTLWPQNLAVFYPFPSSINGLHVVGTAVVLLSISAAVLWRGREWPWLPVGWFWFVGTLVPVIGLVYVGLAALADRYTYVPLLGLATMIAWTAPELLRDFPARRFLLAGAGMAALAACIAASSRQISYWKNDFTLFQQAIRVAGPTDVAHVSLGLGSFKAGDYEQAIHHYSEALRLNPRKVEAMTNLANVFVAQGKFEQAVAQLDRAIALDPKSAINYSNLGNLHLILGRPEEALSKYRKSLQLNPNLVLTQVHLGQLLLDLNQVEEAAQCFREALRTDSALVNAHLGLGRALARQNQLSGAIGHFETAVRLNPALVPARLQLADGLLRTGRIEDSLAQCEAVLKLDPKSAAAHYQIGLALNQRGDLQGALARYERAVAVQPNYAQAHNNLGNLYAATGQPEKAIAHYLEGLRSNPANLEVLNNLAGLLAQTGRFEEAIAVFEQALQLNPRYLPSLRNLVWLRAGCPDARWRDAARALELAERGLEVAGSSDCTALDALAAALAEAGRFPEAAEKAKRALELAGSAQQTRLASDIARRLDLYTAGQPYRLNQ